MIADPLRLLTVKELTERLRISLATGYALVKQGKIASLRIGSSRGAIRVREADLEQYLEDSRQQGTGEKQKATPVRLQLKHMKLK